MLSTILCPTQMVNWTLEESLKYDEGLETKVMGWKSRWVHCRTKNNFPQKSCCWKSRWGSLQEEEIISPKSHGVESQGGFITWGRIIVPISLCQLVWPVMIVATNRHNVDQIEMWVWTTMIKETFGHNRLRS